MAVVGQFRGFRSELQGYLEVTFDDFRKKLLPLKKKRDWDTGEAAYVKSLADLGAGRALQKLYGERHPAAKLVLGEGEIERAPFSRAELDEHMVALIKSCQLEGWPATRYRSYLMYLDSAMTVGELDEYVRAQNHAASLVQAAAPRKELKSPERDLFAEMYRGASPVVKQIVQDHILAAMDAAAEAGKS